jgi:hypothetical protein
MIRPRFVVSLFLLAVSFIFSTQTFAQDRAQLLLSIDLSKDQLKAKEKVFLEPSLHDKSVQDRAQFVREMDFLREQMKIKEKEFLAPSLQDRVAFSEFFSQPNTGLIRLMPREANQNKLSTNGGGAYYSFARLTHEYGYGSDIQLEQDIFSVGFAGVNFGFLTNLGDVPLESVNQQHPALEYLVTFTTPLDMPNARKSKKNTRTNFQVKEFTYRRSLPATVNMTYAVRSVNYRSSDLLTVFRVLRKDSDGSLIIAWKLIKQYPIPELIRP